MANGQTTRYIYDGEDFLLEYDGSNVVHATYTHGPGIDEPLSRTVVTSGVSGGVTALLASTADGLRGPLVDDTIVVNGQIYLGFITGSSFMPPVGQPIDSTSSHLPVAPIDVTAAATSGTLTVSLVDTATLSGNAPLYLVLREQATGRVLDSQLLFPARLTATSTAQPGLPTVIASTTVPVSSAVAGSTLYYHQDGLGTVTELTDTNGNVAKAYAYDAYGNLLESPGTVEQPYTYTGREFDSESGLYYYRARYYDAATGRFLQKDPIGFGGGSLNLYSYVGSSVPNRIDPFGLIDTVSEAIKRAAARGDVGELEALLEATGNQAAKSAIDRLRSRATDIIAKECKGSINREFPEQLRQKTLEEIFELAKKGDESARTAKKLLSDLRFKK